jgi:hypothetical protein
MKKRIAAVIIAPIIGAILGYLLVTALMNGWFSSRWQMIEKPPGERVHLVAHSEDNLWVQSDTGTIYYNNDSSSCESGCWMEVPEIPDDPFAELDKSKVTKDDCAPSPPLGRVAERISECRRTAWVDYNSTFVLRNDGNIYLWQAELYKEWSVVLLFSGICIGALVLFVPALVIVLFLGLRDWRSRRANKNIAID